MSPTGDFTNTQVSFPESRGTQRALVCTCDASSIFLTILCRQGRMHLGVELLKIEPVQKPKRTESNTAVFINLSHLVSIRRSAIDPKLVSVVLRRAKPCGILSSWNPDTKVFISWIWSMVAPYDNHQKGATAVPPTTHFLRCPNALSHSISINYSPLLDKQGF